MVFFIMYPKIMYLGLVIEVEAVLCFLLYQDTTTLFRKK